MKSWAAGAESAGGKATLPTVESPVSGGAQASAEAGPQFAMSRQVPPCVPGMDEGHEPQGGMGTPCGPGASPPWWQSPWPAPAGMDACAGAACAITMR